MKQQILRFGVVLLVLAALPLAGGVGTGKARPFQARSVGYILADNTEINGTYDFVMNGQATHLGRFELQLLGILWFPEGPEGPMNVSSGSMIAANGDSVNIHMVDYFDHFDDSLGVVARGTYAITGGTGRFANASGTGSYIAIVDVIHFLAPITTFAFDGTVVF
jgi:hypothetical protein